MKKHLLKLLVVLFFASFLSKTSAQTRVSHEVGAFFGIASLQTDFGISGYFESANAATMGFGLSYYMKFFGSQYNWRSGSSYFSEHFKMKVDFSYINNSNIEHKNLDQVGDRFRKIMERMTGSVKMYNAGVGLEYYFIELEDYSSFYMSSGSINPFISLGLQYTYAEPDIFVDGVSLKGQEEPYEDLIPKWQEGAIDLENQNMLAATASAGVRFGLDAVDLLVEGRYQYWFSDKLEGLYAPDDPGNKNNDTMVFINVGVVYVFGKN